MPPHAHNISAGRPAAPDTAPFPVLHGLLELAKGIAIRCFCLGDFSPHDSGLRSGAARAAMSLRPTRSASPGIPPSPTLPSVPRRRSDSDFWAARQGSSHSLLRSPDETMSCICCRDHAAGTCDGSENQNLPSSHYAQFVPSTLDPDDV